jgi:preprotein translocase subunit SecG
MTLLRRFLVLQLLMIWQGGFLFYSAVVVPIGTEVLGGSFEQGKITRWVTADMNAVGAVALGVFAWELLATGRASSRRRWLLWGSWLVMAGGLVALVLLHPQMVEMVNPAKSRLTGNRAEFRFLHRTYLWISTFQWIAGLVLALALVWSWRKADRETLNQKKGIE